MKHLLLGAFTDPQLADRTISELEALGYDRGDISVISKSDRYEAAGYDRGDNLAEGAVSGATTGAAIGGLAGLLAGIGVFPALAGFFIGGPIGAALGLTGAAASTVSGAATGAVAGGLIGALMNLGLSSETARSYEQTVNEGGIVVGITENDSNSQVRQIFQRNGALDISQLELERPTEEVPQQGYMQSQQPVFGETIVTREDVTVDRELLDEDNLR
jgi:uncharacterized membrane protein